MGIWAWFFNPHFCRYIYIIKIAKEGVGFVQFAFFFAFKWGFWERLCNGCVILLAILGDWFCLNKHHSCNSLSPLPIRWRTLEEVQKNPPLAWFRSESYVYIHIEKENIRLRHTLLGGRIVCLYTHRERKYTPTPHTARWEGLWRRFHIVSHCRCPRRYLYHFVTFNNHFQ